MTLMPLTIDVSSVVMEHINIDLRIIIIWIIHNIMYITNGHLSDYLDQLYCIVYTSCSSIYSQLEIEITGNS